MAPASIIRGSGRSYYYYSSSSLSLCKNTPLSCHLLSKNPIDSTQSSISSAPSYPFSRLLRLFSTSDFDNLFQTDANRNASSSSSSSSNPSSKAESFQSNSPPHPIPNRPLRADSSSNRRRPPPPSQRQNPQLNRPLRNESSNRDASGADFLERFKLGFDNKENNTRDSNTNVERNAEGERTADSPEQPPQDADEIFKKMKETGLIPNAVAMLDGLCKDGLVQEAMKLFGLMREKGTIPEVVIYTAVVEGFLKAQKFDDAIRIFRKMQSNNIVPNAFSYGLLVQGLCKGKRLENAVEFCVEMLEAGHSPNLATFTGLIDGFCREKGLEDAKSIVATLRQKGFFFDEKAAREYLDKKGPFLPIVWEAIVGKKAAQRSSLFD